MQRSLFLTWNDSTRSKSLARVLGIRRVLLVPGWQSGPARHAFGAFQTACCLARHRPELIWYQFSLVLGLVLATYAVLRGQTVALVADVHTKALRRSGWRVFRPLVLWIKGWALRSSTAVVVSNADNADYAQRRFGLGALALPDPLPAVPEGLPPSGGPSADVVFVCSFAVDEPLATIADVASRLGPDVSVLVTGDPVRLPKPVRKALLRHARLAGFLPERDYWALLEAAKCVVVLSTEPACLPCGAYEAIAAGKRPVIADDPMARSVFGSEAVYAKLDADALECTIRSALTAPSAVRDGPSYEARWQTWWSALQQEMGGAEQ